MFGNSEDPVMVYMLLVDHPGQMYMNASRTKVYAIAGDGKLVYFTHDYGDMSDEDVNLYIQKVLTSQLN